MEILGAPGLASETREATNLNRRVAQVSISSILQTGCPMSLCWDMGGEHPLLPSPSSPLRFNLHSSLNSCRMMNVNLQSCLLPN